MTVKLESKKIAVKRVADDTTKAAELRKILERIVERGHPYAAKMAKAGVRPEHIRTLDDLPLLPYTTKQDLQDTYPLGWLACDRNELVRFHATSGTTGNPTVVAYNAQDRANWAGSVAWCLGLAGVNADDIVQVAYGYGLFTGGLGLHDGAERVGAAVIPTSGGFTERQVKMIKDLQTTVLACTPSYALRIAEILESGEKTSLRVGIFGAEAWSDEFRRDLEKRLGITALDIYGLCEAMGPGVAMECLEQSGLHVTDDFIPEIVHPATLEVQEPGEMGELVLTSWNKQAYPVIRYRTKDLTRLGTELCPCGDATPRIARIAGRSDDMLILNGVNIFPSQIESVLCKIPELTANYQIKAWRENGMQRLSIVCERRADAADIAKDELERRATKKLKETVGVNIPLSILDAGSLPRSEGKAVRIVKMPDGAQPQAKSA